MHSWRFTRTHSVFCYTFFRYVVSRFPYFTWIMLGVTLSAIAVQVYELYIPISQLVNPKYIWLSDIVFIMATLIELVLKVFVFFPSTTLTNLSCTNAGSSKGVVFKSQCGYWSCVGRLGLDNLDGNICSYCCLPSSLSNISPQSWGYVHRVVTMVQVSCLAPDGWQDQWLH